LINMNSEDRLSDSEIARKIKKEKLDHLRLTYPTLNHGLISTI